jgi:hypothetical protein
MDRCCLQIAEARPERFGNIVDGDGANDGIRHRQGRFGFRRFTSGRFGFGHFGQGLLLCGSVVLLGRRRITTLSWRLLASLIGVKRRSSSAACNPPSWETGLHAVVNIQ